MFATVASAANPPFCPPAMVASQFSAGGVEGTLVGVDGKLFGVGVGSKGGGAISDAKGEFAAL